jgi:hypothetical protein
MIVANQVKTSQIEFTTRDVQQAIGVTTTVAAKTTVPPVLYTHGDLNTV